MALVPWDPMKNLMSLQDRMNRLFDETMQRRRGTEALDQGTWTPPVDIYETESEIVLVAELPGVDEKDVDIVVEDNLLTIKGERRMEKSVKEESYHRVERAYGGFARSFTLPHAVDSDKITATANKGVIEIRLPKPEKAKTHQIKIETKD